MTESAASPRAEPSPGIRAYFAFALGCAFFAYAFLQRVAPSVMTDDLMRDFAVGGAALGSLSAFYFYAYASIQIPVGVLVDRFGPRRLMAGALALCAVGGVLFGLSENLIIAAIGRALIGGTVAFGFVGTMTIVAHWFPTRQFPVLVGILQSVGMVGAIGGQAPLSLAVEAGGWRVTILFMAALAFALAVAIVLVVRDNPNRVAGDSGIGPSLKRVAARRDSWLCAIVGFTMAAPMLAFAGLWAVPWLIQVRGLDRADAAFLASVIFIGWLIGSPLTGWLSQWAGRRKLFLLCGLLMGGGSLAAMLFLPITNPVLLGALCFANGLGGCAMVLNFAIVREVNAPTNAGAAMGMVNMCVTGSGAVFQPLIGWLLDINWDGTEIDGVRIYDAGAYSIALGSLLIAYGIGLAACLALRETYGRQLVAR